MKSNQKGFGAVEGLLILILLTMVGFTGYYVYHSRNNANSTYDSATKAGSSSVQTPTAQSSESKTYSNSAYSLSFKYPQNARIDDNTSTKTGRGDNFPWYAQSDYVKLYLDINGLGTTYAKLVLNDSDIQKTIGAAGGGGTIEKQYRVNGMQAYYVTGYGNGGAGSPGIVYIVVGPKYSFVLFSENSSRKSSLDSLVSSISMN